MSKSLKKDKAAPSRIADNRKAWHDYFIEEKYEAGLALEGWEVKSLRAGRAQLKEAYVIVDNGEVFLIIDPEECIDCGACVPECPVEAIYAEDDVPDAQREWIARNKELAAGWKPIIERKPAPADADQWAKVKDKKHLLEK